MTSGGSRNLIAGYRRALDNALHHRLYCDAGRALPRGLHEASSSALVLRSELSPVEDRGVIFGFISAPKHPTASTPRGT